MQLFRRKAQQPADVFADSDRIRGVQDWLEHTSLIPIFIVTLSAIVFRSSFTWALGALNIHSLNAFQIAAINMCVGICIALSTETIGSMAGRKWYVGWDTLNVIDERHAEASASIKKTKKFKQDDGTYVYREIEDPRALKAANLAAKQKQRQKRDNLVNFWFMILGLVASFYATMRYAFQSLDITGPLTVGIVLNVLQDAIISLIILAVVFYLGVIYEPSQANDDEIAQKGRKRLRFGLVKEAFDKVRENTYENKHLRFLMQGATPAERLELEAMMINEGAEMWSTAQIAEWLGWEGQSKRREITRRLKAAYEGGMDGIQHDPDNARNWIADVGVIPIVFAAEFKARAARGNQAPTLGSPSAKIIDADPNAGPLLRQTSDNPRIVDAAKPEHDPGNEGVNGAGASGDDTTEEYRRWEAEHIATVTRLAQELQFIENAFRVAIENDPMQDLEVLAARFNMPLAHARTIKAEVLDRHLLTDQAS